MPSYLPIPLIPYHPATTIQSAELLATAIRDYLRDLRQLNLTDLDALLQYFQQPAAFRIQGTLELTFSAKSRRAQDGMRLSEAETVRFGATGYNIRLHRLEDYYGEYYTINEDRLNDHMSFNELLHTSAASFERLMEIMENPQAKLTVAPHRFAVLKRRPSSQAK